MSSSVDAHGVSFLGLDGHTVQPVSESPTLQVLPPVTHITSQGSPELIAPEKISKHTSRSKFDLREVNARLPFVRRVVAHPQKVVVPDQSGIAAVATAGQL